MSTAHKDDRQQQQLPYGAAQGSYDERRLKVGMTIGAMYDPKTEALSDSYTGAPVMELRVLMLLMLDEEARGRLLTPEDMVRPPWGLLCSERTVRRILKFGQDLGILQSDKRLDTSQQKFSKAWRIDWPGINRFIRSRGGGQIGKSDGQPDQSSGQIGKSGGQVGQTGEARTSSSFSFLSKDDVDVVLGNPASSQSEKSWPDWPNEPSESTGHLRGDAEAPESVNEPPHGGPHGSRSVSSTPRRAVNSDVTALVGLVRQCSVFAAERAVQTAIGHGHDVAALVAGWRRFCRPGCDPDFAAKRLFYRLVDPPMGLEPHQGWIVQYPHRVKSCEAEERDAIKRRREIERSEQLAYEQQQRESAKRWILSIDPADQQSILEEYRREVTEMEATVNRRSKAPLEEGLFLTWLAKRNGGDDVE